MAEIVDWSALPIDALEAISNRLTFDPDHIRFRSVCTAWRSAAPKRPQLPWRIGHRKDEHGNHTLFSFFKSSSTRLEISPIPELPASPILGGMPCRGSSHGWMALLDFVGPSVVLWNPVTKSKIHLPNLTQFSDVVKNRKIFKAGEREHAVSLLNPIDMRVKKTVSLRFKVTQYYLANQVVLSSDPAVSADFLPWPSAAAEAGCHSTGPETRPGLRCTAASWTVGLSNSSSTREVFTWQPVVLCMFVTWARILRLKELSR